MFSNGKGGLSQKYLDTWPSILEKNVCECKAANTVEFFMPSRPFDEVWVHELLSSKGYKSYNKPIKYWDYQEDDLKTDSKLSESLLKSESEPYIPYTPPKLVNTPITLAEQNEIYAAENKIREQVIIDVNNQTWPWWTEKPFSENFKDINALRNRFRRTDDQEILCDIYMHQCQLVIIDLGPHIGINYMERWIKFGCYTNIVVLTRCERLARQILLLGKTFYTLIFKDNPENTWQDELTRALNAGVEYAKEKDVFGNCAKPFAFVFSSEQGMSTCNTYQILQKT